MFNKVQVFMNNIRMLIFDLDGTILNSDNLVSPITASILNTCKLKGYYIGFITARSRSKKNVYLLSKLPCDFIAFYNGAMIYARNFLIESNTLHRRQANKILKKISKEFPKIKIDIHQEPWFFSNSCNCICNMETGEQTFCTLAQLPNLEVQRIRLKSEFLRFVPLKIYMVPESIFYYTISGDAIIVHKSANKGDAVRKASRFFNIPLSQIAAFGDDINDIEMIKNVGTGIAMGNAVSELKNIADYITETNDNTGIATWINEYLL